MFGMFCRYDAFMNLFFFTEFGELFMGGWNNKGQLGLGDTEDRTILCAVRGIPHVQDISCGWNHNLVITGIRF